MHSNKNMHYRNRIYRFTCFKIDGFKISNCHFFNLDALTYAGNLENIKDIESAELYLYKGNICDAVLVMSIFKTIK